MFYHISFSTNIPILGKYFEWNLFLREAIVDATSVFISFFFFFFSFLFFLVYLLFLILILK